jgi:hypothetical protein
LIERLSAAVGESGMSEQLSEFAWLLLDQARIVEGEQLPDPPAFARRLAILLERGPLGTRSARGLSCAPRAGRRAAASAPIGAAIGCKSRRDTTKN